MTPAEYIIEAQRTNPTDRNIIAERLYYSQADGAVADIEMVDTLHGAIGLCTEVGELNDIVKRELFYGRKFDASHMLEELGDIFWYLALICHANDLTFEECFDANINKLKQRFPEKFTEHDALNRNIGKEYEALNAVRKDDV